MSDDVRAALDALEKYAPPEVAKDDFAYDRLLESVHEFARDLLARLPAAAVPVDAERLRAALKRIADLDPLGSRDTAPIIARAALAAPSEP